MRNFTNSIREAQQGGLQPSTFAEFLSHIRRPGGYWQVIARDKLTGEIIAEQWLENAYTDNGVATMWGAICGSASSFSSTPGNILAIDASLGWTTLTANIAAGGTVTSIQVAAPTGPNIPSGTLLVINPGTANTLSVTLTQAITGAGTVTVASVPGPTSLIASGASVRYGYTAVPTADPSSLSSPASYTSAMPSGQFSNQTSGGFSGYGKRQLTATNSGAYLFSTSGSPAASAGSYTCAWLCNHSPISANNQTFIRVAFDTALTISSTLIGQVNLTEIL